MLRLGTSIRAFGRQFFEKFVSFWNYLLNLETIC